MLPVVNIPTIPGPQTVTLPGGVSIDTLNTVKVGTTPTQAIQPALTPLVPIFDIIGAVLSMFNIIKTIIEALGDPTKIALLPELLVDLTAKMARLAGLVPSLSLPLAIVSLIDFIIDTLNQAKTQINTLQEKSAQVDEVRAKATELGDAQLMEVADASQANINKEAENPSITLASTNSMMVVLNVFLGLIGGPAVPDLSSLSGMPIGTLSTSLDSTVETLRTVRGAVPVP